jgi:undecaprenyl-diphosphatase
LVSLAAVLLVSAVVIHPHDRAILESIHAPASPFLDRLAGELGEWGDFLTFNLLGLLIVWSAAALGRARWVQRVAVAALMSAILSGVVCNVFRLSLGRARPQAGVEDRFYGLPGVFKGWRYHGFPSGHTTTAVAGASTVGLAVGPAGAAVIVLSGSVAWGRMYKRQHYPTDVLVGATLGGIYGLATGWRLRQIRLRLDRIKRARRLAQRAEVVRLDGERSLLRSKWVEAAEDS